jgi:Family of unknown function (DUF5335)
MTTRKLDKAQWRGFLDHMSKLLEGKRAEVEAASLNLGDQIEAEWVPIIGVTYDPKDDLIDVELEGLDHMIHKPRELYVENGIGVASLGIVDADGVMQIVKFKDPMMLPPPQH